MHLLSRLSQYLQASAWSESKIHVFHFCTNYLVSAVASWSCAPKRQFWNHLGRLKRHASFCSKGWADQGINLRSTYLYMCNWAKSSMHVSLEVCGGSFSNMLPLWTAEATKMITHLDLATSNWTSVVFHADAATDCMSSSSLAMFQISACKVRPSWLFFVEAAKHKEKSRRLLSIHTQS